VALPYHMLSSYIAIENLDLRVLLLVIKLLTFDYPNFRINRLIRFVISEDLTDFLKSKTFRFREGEVYTYDEYHKADPSVS
jgi:hypothetical protein